MKSPARAALRLLLPAILLALSCALSACTRPGDAGGPTSGLYMGGSAGL